MKGLASKEAVVLIQWGNETRKFDVWRVDKGQIITIRAVLSL